MIAGVDGCKAGWIAVTLMSGEQPAVAIFRTFAALVDHLPGDAVIAVDMPIGLREITRKGGRGPEMLVRPLLGACQSSVFSIPSRAAVYAAVEEFTTLELWYGAHRMASAVARTTSEPTRGVSIQAFGIFPKIREIDALLRARPELGRRIIESHPEVAFWRLNGEQAMRLPKKVKRQVNPAGMAERRTLLAGLGLRRDFLEAVPPRGAAADDFLDACALLFIAARHARGQARPFPDPPDVDAHGVPIAIWV
jgi:predicted RNase H-like nuclease